MLSAQMDTEFTAGNYDDIKKVYSIWICMDCPNYAKNTITRYGITQENALGNFPKDKTRYDLLETVMVCLSEDIASGDGLWLHRLLGILFSTELNVRKVYWRRNITFWVHPAVFFYIFSQNFVW